MERVRAHMASLRDMGDYTAFRHPARKTINKASREHVNGWTRGCQMARHTLCTQKAKGAGVTAQLEEHLDDVHEALGSVRRKPKQKPQNRNHVLRSNPWEEAEARG